MLADPAESPACPIDAPPSSRTQLIVPIFAPPNRIGTRGSSIALAPNASDQPPFLSQVTPIWTSSPPARGWALISTDDTTRKSPRSVGGTSRAVAFGEEALAIAAEQGNRIHRAYALNVLGSIAHYEARPERALPLHRQALAVAHEIGDVWATLWALDGVASALAWQGRHEAALPLLAAAERWQAETGQRHPPAERELHARDVAAARAQLGDRYADAWQRGERMSRDEAVAHALAAAT